MSRYKEEKPGQALSTRWVYVDLASQYRKVGGSTLSPTDINGLYCYGEYRREGLSMTVTSSEWIVTEWPTRLRQRRINLLGSSHTAMWRDEEVDKHCSRGRGGCCILQPCRRYYTVSSIDQLRTGGTQNSGVARMSSLYLLPQYLARPGLKFQDAPLSLRRKIGDTLPQAGAEIKYTLWGPSTIFMMAKNRSTAGQYKMFFGVDEKLFLPALGNGPISFRWSHLHLHGRLPYHNITEKYAKGRSTGGQRQNISGRLG